MIITVTSIKLRSIFGFFSLSWQGYKITQQLRSQKGFIKMKNTGFGYLHYTLTVWEDEESMKKFAREGAHKDAMKLSGKLSHEIRTYTYQNNEIPNWNEVKKLLENNSKVLTFN